MNNFKQKILIAVPAVMLSLIFIGNSPVMAQVQLEFGDYIAGLPGESFSIPVTADLGSEEISNFDFTIKIDTSMLNIDPDTDVEAGDWHNSNFFESGTRTGAEDELLIGTAGGDVITGEVLLFTITGTFKDKVEINPNGIQVTVVNLGDGTIDTAPSTPFSEPVMVSDTAFQLPSIEGTVNENVTESVNTDDLAAQNIDSFSFSFSYDPDVIQFNDVSTDNTVSSGGTVSYDIDSDSEAGVNIMTISADKSARLSSGTDLLNLNFRILSATTGSKFVVTHSRFLADNNEIPVVGKNGNITTSGNVAPSYISTLPDTTLNEGNTLTFTYVAEDVNGNDITYSIGGDTPDEATINAETGEFSFPLDYQTAGEHTITVEASDGAETVSTSATLTVKNTNRAPEFVTVLSDRSIKEGVKFDFTYEANDPDGDELTYSLEEAPSGTSIHETTGQLSWNVKYGTSGDYAITVDVTDGKETVSTTAILTVTDINRGLAFETVMPDTTIKEGIDLEFTYKAEHPNGDELTYSLKEGPSGADINEMTGLFSWETGYESAGEYTVVVEVTDGTETISTSADIIVSNVNRTLNFVNVLPDTTIAEGNKLEFTYKAEDPDSDELNYSLEEGPSGASIDKTTGQFSWDVQYETSGEYIITVDVTDGDRTISTSAIVKVIATNRAPEFVKILPDLTISEGSTLEFTYEAVDPDGDELIYSIIEGPTEALLDEVTGAFSWKINYESSGEQIISVEVSDGENTTTTSATLVVKDESDPSHPTAFQLQQNYPNPFNPITQIRYGIPQSAEVRLEVFNLFGQRVTTLVDSMKPAGWHTTTFDASGLSSGVYVYRITASEFVSAKKLMLIK